MTTRGKRLSTAARRRIVEARQARGFSAWSAGGHAKAAIKPPPPASAQLRLFDHVSLPPRNNAVRPEATPTQAELPLQAEQPTLFDETREAAEGRRAGGASNSDPP